MIEPLSGYLLLAQKLYDDGKYNGPWNFGPNIEDCKSVEWILDFVNLNWKENIQWELDSDDNPHEAKLLRLDISKAQKKLNGNLDLI